MQQDRISCGAKVEYMNAVTALISESGNMSYKFCLQWHVCKKICLPSSKKNTHKRLASDPKLKLGTKDEWHGIHQNGNQQESAC